MTGKSKFGTPILLLIFNRPDLTFKVFEEIKKVKPGKLYIGADGPRENKPGEKEKCERARTIADHVDWDCEIKTLFRKNNLGCKKAVSSAITWFFSQEEEGIILEDDCLPNQSFFYFCTEMLHRYREDSEVMHIGANNFINHHPAHNESYYFSKYNHIWGWASWRRAWNKYDVDMKNFPEFYKQKAIDKIFGNNGAKYYWLYKFMNVYQGKVDTWDYQWTFAIWKEMGKSITPSVNLVSNIGFEGDGTHTMTNVSNLENLPRHEIEIIKDPPNKITNEENDSLTDKLVFKLTLLKRVASFFLVQLKQSKITDLSAKD